MVGYEPEGVWLIKTGRIQDEYLIPYLSKGDYDKAVLSTYQVLAAEAAKEYDVTLSNETDTAQSIPSESKPQKERKVKFCYFNYCAYIIYCRFNLFREE